MRKLASGVIGMTVAMATMASYAAAADFEVHMLNKGKDGVMVSIVNQLAEPRGEWLGYPGSLSQVLLNLLGNAQRYAYPEDTGGDVEITLANDGGGDGGAYRIAVRDFGHGIPPENLGRIFEPFFTTGRGKGGSGLGMAIVYNIVTVHLGGAISVESTAGTGTTVTLILPRVVPG